MSDIGQRDDDQVSSGDPHRASGARPLSSVGGNVRLGEAAEDLSDGFLGREPAAVQPETRALASVARSPPRSKPSGRRRDWPCRAGAGAPAGSGAEHHQLVAGLSITREKGRRSSGWRSSPGRSPITISSTMAVNSASAKEPARRHALWSGSESCRPTSAQHGIPRGHSAPGPRCGRLAAGGGRAVGLSCSSRTRAAPTSRRSGARGVRPLAPRPRRGRRPPTQPPYPGPACLGGRLTPSVR